MNKHVKNILACYGYNLIALPKSGIAPLQLLYKQEGHLKPVNASVEKLFQSASKILSDPTKDRPVVNIADSVSLEFDVRGGGNLLAWLQRLPQVVKVNADLNLKGSDQVMINFQNIREDIIDLLELDNFLSMGRPVEGLRTFKEKLYDSELYVISAVLKSSKFTVSVMDGNVEQGNVGAQVGNMGSVNAAISNSKEKKVLLAYEGNVDLFFAFKAQQIIYDRKRWWELWEKGQHGFRIKDVSKETMKSAGDFPTVTLEMGDEVVDI